MAHSRQHPATSHRERRDLESRIRASRPADYRTRRPAGTARRVERPASRLSPVGALLLTAVAASIAAGAYFTGGDPAEATSPTPAPASVTPAQVEPPCCPVEIDGREAQASDVPAVPTAAAAVASPVAPTPAVRVPAPAVDDDVAALNQRIPAPEAPAPVPAAAVPAPANADSTPEDVQMQLPEEHVGGQIDLDDGRRCTITGENTMECQ